MFIKNKYHLWYFNIIKAARSRDASGLFYTEKHHIIPKSLGGDNSKSNLVKLTAREHFVCHKMLCKMTEGLNKRKMCYAVTSFFRNNKSQQRVLCSKDYEFLKRISAYNNSNNPKHKNKLKGVNSPRFGQRHTLDTKNRISKGHSIGKWHSPWGVFDTVNLATKYVKSTNIIGIKDNDTFKKYCTTQIDIPIGGKRSIKTWIGLTPRELGFKFEEANGN